MSDFSINAPTKLANTKSEWVWFKGATALLEGQGVVYDSVDVTLPVLAATVADARRTNWVKVPDAAANLFAGVCARNYSAKAGGQMIEIYVPGSVCYVLTYNVTTVIAANTALLLSYGTVNSITGAFKLGSATGKAGALALQTVTGTTAWQKVLAILETGPFEALGA